MTQLTRRHLFAGAAAVGAVFAGSNTIISPASASAPVAGTQNAGWYRYKVGDFEVTVVTDGQGANPWATAMSPTRRRTQWPKILRRNSCRKIK